MKRIIKKLKRYKAKTQKYRALYRKWFTKELDTARALQSAYYSKKNMRNVALEMLREYGLDREIAEVDEDEHDTKAC